MTGIAEQLEAGLDELESLFGTLPVDFDMSQQLVRDGRVIRVLRQLEEIQRLPSVPRGEDGVALGGVQA